MAHSKRVQNRCARDGRTYDYAYTLRAVTAIDGMTAGYYPFSHKFLGETATRIINQVDGINRVTYEIKSKPPGTIEWEQILKCKLLNLFN